MSKPEVLVLIFLAVFALAFGPQLTVSLLSALVRPRAAVCSSCGAQIHCSYSRCEPCIARENAIESGWSEIGYAERARQRAIDAERREAERVAARAEVLVVGSVSVDPHGAVTFDGWQFKALSGMGPGQVVPIQGRISPGALIAGWRQSELHVLAHGQHCACLSRAGAWVR